MHTVTTDKYKRVRLPDAKPKQVFAYANTGDGSITLTPVKAERKTAFPRGSLLKYFIPERNQEELERLSGCSLDLEDADGSAWSGGGPSARKSGTCFS